MNRFLEGLTTILAHAGLFFVLAAIAGGAAAFGWMLYEYFGWILLVIIGAFAWAAWSINYFLDRREA